MNIVLHGNLKDLYKEEINLELNNWYQIYGALSSIIPDFRKQFETCTEVYIIKKTGDDKQCLNEQTIAFPLNCEELHIIPSVNGSGLETAAAMWVGGQLVAAGFSASVIYAGMALAFVVTSIALKVAIGYVIAQLSPKPDTNNGSVGAEQKESFFFSGATNVTRPGTALPLVYGEILAGSVVISIGSEATDIMTA